MRVGRAPGCGADEVAEDLARRCLRFDNRIGNAGQGTFEIRLSAVRIVALGLAFTKAGHYRGQNCFDPSLGLLPHAGINDGESTIFSGLTPNWYDLYSWSTPDQYVDITDVEDGVYELVSVSNSGLTAKETVPGDNEASTVFRMTGNNIEVLKTKTAAPTTP